MVFLSLSGFVPAHKLTVEHSNVGEVTRTNDKKQK